MFGLLEAGLIGNREISRIIYDGHRISKIIYDNKIIYSLPPTLDDNW